MYNSGEDTTRTIKGEGRGINSFTGRAGDDWARRDLGKRNFLGFGPHSLPQETIREKDPRSRNINRLNKRETSSYWSLISRRKDPFSQNGNKYKTLTRRVNGATLYKKEGSAR